MVYYLTAVLCGSGRSLQLPFCLASENIDITADQAQPDVHVLPPMFHLQQFLKQSI